MSGQGDLHAARGGAHVRPFFWSVRREVWENRSITVAPLAIASLVLLGFLVGTFRLPGEIRAAAADPDRAASVLTEPYDFIAIVIMLAAGIVGVFYCLDALHGERRDRSILFWKSLPVSDATAVLGKASIPLLVLPVVACATILVTQVAMLVVSLIVAVADGLPLAALWTSVPLVPMWLTLIYGFATLALWHAPVYAWLLLVSAWARRLPLLWAVLPPLALCVLERIAFGSWHVARMLADRIGGGFVLAFDFRGLGHGANDHPLARIEIGRFLGSAGLWIGLGATVILLTGAVWLRRDREPI